MRRIVVALVFALAGPLTAAQTLPKPALTPGKDRGLSKVVICRTKWGKDARHVTEQMKQQVADAYGIPRASIVGQTSGPCCEFDHLVSREIGGADVVENLWPQPWTEAKKKDQLENLLHKLVCDGKVPLKTVQAAIATDWVKAYTKYEGHAP
jgi:hypothetical protein